MIEDRFSNYTALAINMMVQLPETTIFCRKSFNFTLNTDPRHDPKIKTLLKSGHFRKLRSNEEFGGKIIKKGVCITQLKDISEHLYTIEEPFDFFSKILDLLINEFVLWKNDEIQEFQPFVKSYLKLVCKCIEFEPGVCFQ